MNKLNPHVFIDGIEQYVVIIKLKNCKENGKPYILAMYSERALVYKS